VDISERYLSSSRHPQAVPFLVRDVIYTSHAYAMMPSVHLSVMFVHCGHRVRVQWIPDIFACLDRWMSLLLTDNASPGSSDGMMPGFLVEVGGMEKLVIVVISLILLTESLDWKHVTRVYVCINNMLTFCNGSCNLGRKCIISDERFVLELPTSR